MKVIIVGGVAGGASTAARLRRLNEDIEITLYERSGYISYANCGLPYYLGEVIKDEANLTLQTPERFHKRFNIDVQVHHEVIALDTNQKTVTVLNVLTGEEFRDTYDTLVLSPGAKAILPDIPGIDSENVFTLRNVEDTFRISRFLQETEAQSVVIAGGGFIGLETAENLKHRGLKVSIVQSSAQMLSALDPDMAIQLHTVLRDKGINLLFHQKITAIDNSGSQAVLSLTNGDTLSADAVIFATGVTPDTSLAQKSGLMQGTRGSIVVNDRMETSAPGVYAIGDAVEVTHFITGDKALISLAGPANKQGRIVADNIAGGDSRYKGTQGSLILKLFDITAAATGINEKQAKAAGIEYEKIILSPLSHASYYPGGTQMMMKVLFEKNNNRLLGAQIVGREGVDKRIDVIATAIRAHMTAPELAELELSYAPPYSSAKDPVNMVGFVAENLITEKVQQFYYEDLLSIREKPHALLIDVRTPKEYEAGHPEAFINIPVDELRERISEIPKDKTLYLMCKSGIRSYLACRLLKARGYDCYSFAGGYEYYSTLDVMSELRQ